MEIAGSSTRIGPRLATDSIARPYPSPVILRRGRSSSEEVGVVTGVGGHGGEPLPGGWRQPELGGVIALTTASFPQRCDP